MALAPGTALGRYRVVDRIGAGGMGEVYRAEDSTLGRDVAIKTLPEVDAADPLSITRLRDEARAVASLTHPNILSIFDFGFEGPLAYAVMELLEGETIESLIARGPVPATRVVQIGISIAEALAAAHRKELVHRDLKPANVFLTREHTVKILDFGLAQRNPPEVMNASSRTAVRPDQQIAGTLPYMAPEQIQGAPPRPSSDLFSLGILLWEMCTASHPFRRASGAETITALLRDEPQSGGEERLPDPLRRVLLHCMEKDPARRFQSAGDVAFALRSLVTDGVESRQDGHRPPSLCVLPFDCRGDDLDAEFLSEGLAETLINRLAHLPDLTVIARTTAFRYRGTSLTPSGVAAELGTAWVLTGAIRQHRGNLVIQAELIDGRSGSQLWGNRFVRSPEDVFRIEEEIGRAIVEQLAGELNPQQRRQLELTPTASAAYSLYLRGRFEWDRRTRESVGRSMQLFEEAVSIDPSFALAWSGLADACNVSAYHGWSVPSEVQARCLESAQKAIALAPNLPEALVSLAGATGSGFGGDLAAARALLRRAIELKPSYATAVHWLSHNELCSGNLDEATRLARRAVEIDPHATSVNLWLGETHYYARDYGRAADTYRKLLPADPESPVVNALLGTALVVAGESGTGIPFIEKALEKHETSRFRALLAHARGASGDGAGFAREMERIGRAGTEPMSAYDKAIALSGGDDPAPVVDCLDGAFEQRLERLLHAPFEPKFDRFRDDGGFREFMERLRHRS